MRHASSYLAKLPMNLTPQPVSPEEQEQILQTIEMFDKATNPLVRRAAPTGFGRKVSNQGFGRI